MQKKKHITRGAKRWDGTTHNVTIGDKSWRVANASSNQCHYSRCWMQRWRFNTPSSRSSQVWKTYISEFHLLWISLKLWTCLKSLTPTHWSVEQRPHCKECEVAMQDEYKSSMQNNTWTLTNLPTRRKHVQCTWVFQIKTIVQREFTRYKVRVVAKGYSQTYGVNHDEIF